MNELTEGIKRLIHSEQAMCEYCDHIIVASLQDVYEQHWKELCDLDSLLNLREHKEMTDRLDAIEQVLQYYMLKGEYEQWLENIHST